MIKVKKALFIASLLLILMGCKDNNNNQTSNELQTDMEKTKMDITNKIIDNYAKGDYALEQYVNEIDNWSELVKECEKKYNTRINGDERAVEVCPELRDSYLVLNIKKNRLFDQLVAHYLGSRRFINIRERGNGIIISRTNAPGELYIDSVKLDDYYYNENHRCIDFNSDEGQRLREENIRDRMHYTYYGNPPHTVCKWARPQN